MSYIVVSVFAALLFASCARAQPQPRPLPSWVFESARAEGVRGHRALSVKPRGGLRGRSEASDLVVAVLQDTGLRFGTDGSVAALWGYLRTSHKTVSPSDTQSGDVLFFQTRPAHPPVGRGCDAPDHVAVVAAVEDDGRIRFAEARDGRIRQSFVDPRYPDLRRDQAGRVLNSFLRPKKVGDPEDPALLAGEMLCAAVRPGS